MVLTTEQLMAKLSALEMTVLRTRRPLDRVLSILQAMNNLGIEVTDVWASERKVVIFQYGHGPFVEEVWQDLEGRLFMRIPDTSGYMVDVFF